MVHIPYKGSSPAVLDLISGRVHLMFDNLASALPNIKAGKVRALAVTTLRRSSFVPELPTLAESGLPGFDLTTWWGLMGPAKMPEAAVERIAVETRKIIDTPEMRERFAAMGSEAPTVRSPREFTAFVEKELKTYSQLVKRSGATVE
jgi:tripartite-type tricarboxylate transporter receptor subunit TctC